MKDLDITLTKEEVDFALQELDKDGNGEIDFEEFLYAMANTDKIFSPSAVGKIISSHYARFIFLLLI